MAQLAQLGLPGRGPHRRSDAVGLALARVPGRPLCPTTREGAMTLLRRFRWPILGFVLFGIVGALFAPHGHAAHALSCLWHVTRLGTQLHHHRGFSSAYHGT